ncbi:MAG: hypothetical protein V4635_15795 [Bacteroidota bacterium]
MFKKILHFICLFLLPLKVFSQQTDKLSFETGLVFNKYFPKEKSQFKNDPLNYFFKIEYAGKTLARDRWSLFIPMGICYSYYAVDYAPGHGGSSIGAQTGNVYHYFTVFVGPQLQYERKRLRFCGALFINNRYVSSRFLGLCRVDKRLWIGPAFEIFYYDIIYSVDEFRNRKHIHNYQKGNFFGLNGSAIRINPGVKLLFDLRY